MISIRGLAYQHGDRILFTDVDLNLNSGRRYGIVGANGSGKSTFLKILAGEYSPEEGEIIKNKESRIGWLNQDQYLHEESCIRDVVMQGREALWKALQKKEKLFASSKENGYEIAAIEEEIERLGGYSAESEAEKLLVGLGVEEKQHLQPLRVLSGGYKLRVLLARTLFANPEILLLDEPTNYLDIESIGWLEKYLKVEFSGLLLFVSHDFDFLNHVATDILDIDYGEIRHYSGNYSYFLKHKKEVVEKILHERDHIEKKVEAMRAFIERFRAKPSKARQCASREKMIEKIEWPELKSTSRIAPKFSFQQKRKSGRSVLKVKGICKAYGQKIVLFDVSFDVERGEKIALIGANGMGKSTLLKVLVQDVSYEDGSFEWGHEVVHSYFAQEHSELQKSKETLFDWLRGHVSAHEQEVKNMLGRMLFSSDEMKKTLDVLSGGELTRLVFGKIMLEQRNMLILDEPTNHLDLEAREALSHSLKAYDGTVLIVSHDRSFISSFAGRVLTITEEGVSEKNLL